MTVVSWIRGTRGQQVISPTERERERGRERGRERERERERWGGGANVMRYRILSQSVSQMRPNKSVRIDRTTTNRLIIHPRVLSN